MAEENDIVKVGETIPVEAELKGHAITVQDLQPIDASDPDFPTGSTAVKVKKEYPLNVLSERRQAGLLGWKVDVLRSVNEQTGIFLQLPTICAGTSGCPFGSICSIPNRDSFIGQPCPLELLEIYKHFSGYVKDLSIRPEDYTDLQLVADLTRLQLEMWRSDMHMRLEPEVLREVKVVDQKTGRTFDQSVVNPHRTKQSEIRKSIHTTYKLLQASRADKASKAESQANVASIMSKIFEEKAK